MSQSQHDPDDSLLSDPALDAVARRSLGQLGALGGSELEGVERQPVAQAREPLFNRKVLIGWALATLVIWMSIKVAVPVIREVARASEGGGGNSVSTIVETRNGRIVIRRTGDGVTIDRVGPEGGATIVIPEATQPPTPPDPAAEPGSAPSAPSGPAARNPTETR